MERVRFTNPTTFLLTSLLLVVTMLFPHNSCGSQQTADLDSWLLVSRKVPTRRRRSVQETIKTGSLPQPSQSAVAPLNLASRAAASKQSPPPQRSAKRPPSPRRPPAPPKSLPPPKPSPLPPTPPLPNPVASVSPLNYPSPPSSPAKTASSGDNGNFRLAPAPPFQYWPTEVTTLVIPVDICGRKTLANMALVQNAWYTTLAQYFAKASFGSFKLPTDPKKNRLIMESVDIGCSGVSKRGVSWSVNSPPTQDILNAWSDAADNLVVQKYGVNLNSFQFYVYLVPPSLYGGSYGIVDCPYNPFYPLRVWSGAQTQTETAIWSLLHELGHNMGLSHSRGYDANNILQEYGDASCPMGGRGSTMPHFNMPQSVILGWTTPQAVLTADDLPVGVWKQYAVRGLADSYYSGLYIKPSSWSMPGWALNDRLYVSFRHYNASTVDASLFPQFWDKVQVHMWRPGTPYRGCAAPVLLANLDDESQTVWPRPGSNAPMDTASPLITVRVTSINSEAGAAFVSVCRSGVNKSDPKCV